MRGLFLKVAPTEGSTVRGSSVGHPVVQQGRARKRVIKIENTKLAHRVSYASSFVALCLSHFREAQGESNLDFANFRFWNLLEVIAQDRIENGTPVTDFDNRELRVRGKKATTNHPEGRVYELLKRYMLLRNFVEHHFGQPLPEGLWDAVQVWCSGTFYFARLSFRM